jgi:hypothetical protein
VHVTCRSCLSKKGVDVYFKIDRFTKQRVMMGITTVTCNIQDAVEYIRDPNTRFKWDNLVKVRERNKIANLTIFVKFVILFLSNFVT